MNTKQIILLLLQSTKTINFSISCADRNRRPVLLKSIANNDGTPPHEDQRQNNNVPRSHDDRSKNASGVYAQLKDSSFFGDVNQYLELTVRDYYVCV